MEASASASDTCVSTLQDSHSSGVGCARGREETPIISQGKTAALSLVGGELLFQLISGFDEERSDVDVPPFISCNSIYESGGPF